MDSDPKELLEYLARCLVERKDEVKVEARETEAGLVLELHVAKEEVGKVIGRQGRLARALRTVVRAGGAAIGKAAQDGHHPAVHAHARDAQHHLGPGRDGLHLR